MATDFSKPRAVTDLEIAFGGGIDRLLPPMSAIPNEFQRGRSQWNRLVSRWFFSGLPKGTEFLPKSDVDANMALRHVKAILGSFQPKHEHKEAGVAYLLSLWFERVELPAEAA